MFLIGMDSATKNNWHSQMIQEVEFQAVESKLIFLSTQVHLSR
jgi:hypothetical protein